jgi:transcriptional regulator with XRE-family HTH domain
MQESLGHKLRLMRAERGLSLREAARRAGVVKETISDIERGHSHPYDVTLAKLAKVYDVPLEELLEEPALAGKAEVPEETGLAEEEGEGRSLALIRGLRAYFWDLRLRWLDPDHKPTPERIQDALDLLHHLREAGAFEGSRTPAERFEVQLLNQAAWQLRPIVAELVGPREDAEDLRQKVDDVFAEIEAR